MSFTDEILVTSPVAYYTGCELLKSESIRNTLSITTGPLIWWTKMIITFCTHTLPGTFSTQFEVYFIWPTKTISFAIEKELIRNTHSICTSIFLLITSIHFQQITIPFILSFETLLNSITDLSPIQTQDTRITCHCLVTDHIPIDLHFICILLAHDQLPLSCLFQSLTHRQSIFAILSKRC